MSAKKQEINANGCTERVRNFLKERGLTVPQLIKKTTLTESTLRRTIRDEQPVSLYTVYAVARAFKQPPEFFFVGAPDDADEEFKARLWALAREIPEGKREALLDIVAAFCRAV